MFVFLFGVSVSFCLVLFPFRLVVCLVSLCGSVCGVWAGCWLLAAGCSPALWLKGFHTNRWRWRIVRVSGSCIGRSCARKQLVWRIGPRSEPAVIGKMFLCTFRVDWLFKWSFPCSSVQTEFWSVSEPDPVCRTNKNWKYSTHQHLEVCPSGSKVRTLLHAGRVQEASEPLWVQTFNLKLLNQNNSENKSLNGFQFKFKNLFLIPTGN